MARSRLSCRGPCAHRWTGHHAAGAGDPRRPARPRHAGSAVVSRCCGRAVRRSGACSRSPHSARPERIDAGKPARRLRRPRRVVPRRQTRRASAYRWRATFEPSEWRRRYLESIVREDVALKQADDRTVGGRSDRGERMRSRRRGAQHESSRTLVHSSAIRLTTFAAWRSRSPDVCNPRRTRDTVAGVASRMAFGTFGPSACDQLVPSWRLQIS